jgi:uncharacterized protein (TIGR02996 family)
VIDRGRALLAQCLDAPDEEAPKLVYADWLEEQGDPAAALIRTSLRGKSVDKLLEKHRWIDGLDPWIRHSGESVFVDGVIATVWGAARSYASKKLQAKLMPLVTKFGVQHTCLYDACKTLGDSETLSWTTSLRWKSCGAGDDVFAALAKSPHLARLISLEIEEPVCTNAGLKKLGRSKHLGRLRELSLYTVSWKGEYDEKGVIDLVDGLPIETLLITGGIGRVDAGGLANAKAMGKLLRFETSVQRDGATKMLRGRAMASLKHLGLGCVETPSDADLEAFLANPTYAKLETLDFEYPGYQPIGKTLLKKLRARFGKGIKAR